ncbi:putative ORFan [Tupanvirus deep ocean]|uniref:ORFan n=2 Tax=Tupanvirus TaxID=2094720 RepID=A0AC62A921_9VIRU|nr:putative ORFan [Tupanvirus deep ocean]QKU34271.1 putative ORFan [Tupanvirus deep ocean]
MSNQEVDLNALRDNLKDLNFLSKKVLIDMQEKNRILEHGLKDCRSCRRFVDNNKNRMHQRRNN